LSIAGNEVEHSLGRVQLRNWWQDTTSVAGEKDDVAWVVRRQARDLCVGDVFNRISTASVLGQSDVIIIDKASLRVENNVLKN